MPRQPSVSGKDARIPGSRRVSNYYRINLAVSQRVKPRSSNIWKVKSQEQTQQQQQQLPPGCPEHYRTTGRAGVWVERERSRGRLRLRWVVVVVFTRSQRLRCCWLCRHYRLPSWSMFTKWQTALATAEAAGAAAAAAEPAAAPEAPEAAPEVAPEAAAAAYTCR